MSASTWLGQVGSYRASAGIDPRRDNMIVKVDYAKTHLSELLAKVEAGEEIIIAK